MIKVTMSWQEYYNCWRPFVDQKLRDWDLQATSKEVVILCSEKLYKEFENQ